MSQIKGIFIYSDFPSRSLSIQEIIDYLKDYGLSAQDRGNFFEFLDPTKEETLELASKIAGMRVLDISEPVDEIREPIFGEINVEPERLTGKASSLGVLYDGLWLQRILHKIMAEKFPDEIGRGFIHVIFTSRLFVTFEKRRYHARVVLTGLPALISTSGIVEAPAKPKEYYWLKAGFARSGKDTRELDIMYEGKFIEYDDPRITEILRAYTLQAIFYELTGDPFCINPKCCLFNSHWQEEVLNTQLEGKLCDEHRKILQSTN
ncbi:MAG TPA: DUF6775 family putative metallopeptidase [Thermodesulfobacteriota bacterium]